MVKKATKERIKVFYDYIEKSNKLKDMSLVFSPRLEEATLTANAKLKKDDIVLFEPLELVYLNDLFRSARKSGHVSMRRELFAVELKEREQEAILKYSFVEKQYVGELEQGLRRYLVAFEAVHNQAKIPAYIDTYVYAHLSDEQKVTVDKKYNLVKHDTELYLTFKTIEEPIKLIVRNQPLTFLKNYVNWDYVDFFNELNRNFGGYLTTAIIKSKDALPSMDLAKYKEMITYGIDALENLSIFIKEREEDARNYNNYNVL